MVLTSPWNRVIVTKNLSDRTDRTRLKGPFVRRKEWFKIRELESLCKSKLD